MNLAQYITDTARIASTAKLNSGFQAYLREKQLVSHTRILEALDEPRTAADLKRMLGYSNGGMYSMIHVLKKQGKIYCMGEIKIGANKHRLWARSTKCPS